MIKMIVIFILCLPLIGLAKIPAENEPTVVQSVDLEKYKGLWYEIAKIPNPFQKKCARNTTAEYALRQDGKIDGINRCTKKDGKIITAKGVAKIVDAATYAKLKVSFVSFLGIRPFWGDYWIMGLDEDYQWAVVGDPARKYGWILSRTPQLSDETRNQVNDILKVKGYDPDRFVNTIQEIQ